MAQVFRLLPTKTLSFSALITRAVPKVACANFCHGASFEEYERPAMKTTVPGPHSKELLRQLSEHQLTKGMAFCVDFEKSSGNYIADADGNVMLDVFQQVASTPLGYNHACLVKALHDPKNVAYLVNRASLGLQPTATFPQDLRDTLLQIAPTGMTEVITMGCGTCAVENAFKVAFMAHKKRVRGSPDPTPDELGSCLKNQGPGTSSACILSFEKAFHGRSLGALSSTTSKALYRVDYPVFDWPRAPFPYLQYPLEDHVEENKAEEDRCIAEARQQILKWNSEDRPVVGIIVEPIQSEGGDNHASPEFFRKLQRLAKEVGALLIVDEVQTGVGSTGKFWAHEHWNLDESPDVVTFSKKMLIGGFYTKPELRPDQPLRIFNTWMGDHSKLLFLKEVLRVIREENLMERARDTGHFLVDGLKQLEKKYPSLFSRPRGVATFCAVDFPDVETRTEFITEARNNGVEMEGCGERSLRFRPSLTFGRQHAQIVLDTMDHVASQISGPEKLRAKNSGM